MIVVTIVIGCTCTTTVCQGRCGTGNDPFMYDYQRPGYEEPPLEVRAAAAARHARPVHRQRWHRGPVPVRPAYRRPCY